MYIFNYDESNSDIHPQSFFFLSSCSDIIFFFYFSLFNFFFFNVVNCCVSDLKLTVSCVLMKIILLILLFKRSSSKHQAVNAFLFHSYTELIIRTLWSMNDLLWEGAVQWQTIYFIFQICVRWFVLFCYWAWKSLKYRSETNAGD